MSFVEGFKLKAGALVAKAKGKAAAMESGADRATGLHVATSRAGKNGEDGTYVGRTGSDVALDVEESGAEARSEQNRNAGK
ncbi:MAG TPA: hypothetical protein VFW69_18385 [Mycobacterium sp.]|nr:hypothetical protein [Mycobacterium sp.]